MEKESTLFFKVNVSISFADADIELAKKIAAGLSEKGVKVYSDNPMLRDSAEDWGSHNFNLIEDFYNNSIQYCIVLISDKYHYQKWNSERKCKVLEAALTKKQQILPVKIGNNVRDLQGVTNLIADLIIEPTDFQFVIDAFINKIKLTTSEIEYLHSYDSIGQIIRIFNQSKIVDKLFEMQDKSERIGYEVYVATDRLNEQIKQYFVYLYAGTRLKRTFDLFSDRFADIISSNNWIILIPKEKEQAKPEIRKSNIQEMFKPTGVYYVDEFLWLHCTSGSFTGHRPRYFIQNFIDPYLQSTSTTGFQYLKDWLNNDNPILVIKGSGGIGKTTIARVFNDYVHDNIPNKKVIFIESRQILSHLVRIAQLSHEPLDLYDVYQAYLEHEKIENLLNGDELTEDLFKLHIDNGNLFIIIDGLDEVISKLDSNFFNITSFVKSIYNFTSELGLGKIILTCRDYFWDKEKPEIVLELIELMPFNTDLAQQFFEKHFKEFPKLASRALNIAKTLMGNAEREEYIPFVLDIICEIIKEDIEEKVFFEPGFDSNILNKDIHSDFIFYKFCKREREKIGQNLDVDLQINFFIGLATKYNSGIKLENIQKVFESEFEATIDDKNIESMKSHPLLRINGEMLTFRYDFFEQHFKNILLGEYLRQKIELNLDVIDILGSQAKYGSIFVKDCCVRLGEFNEEQKFTLYKVLDELINYDLPKHCRRYMKEKAIAGTFNILMALMGTMKSLTTESATALMKELFTFDDHISYFCLYGINDKILFDFSGLKLTDCFISDYDYFWECKFDINTYFDHCTLNSLHKKANINTPALPKNFNLYNCTIDSSVESALRAASENYSNEEHKLISLLQNYLRRNFYASGYMRAERESFLRKRWKENSDIIKILRHYKLIEEFKSEKKTLGTQWKIVDSEAENIRKFCYEGAMPIAVKRIIKEMMNHV